MTDTVPKRLFVIMGNDFPAGVRDDEAAAEALCKERNDAERSLRAAYEMPRIYWRVYPFDLNAVED